MAEPVLLISSDPFLGASLEALADGRIRVARLDPARRPAAWPGEPAATVVLDVAARQRDALHAWIRRHHQGPLVVLLKPGERAPGPGFDPAGVVVGRPFRLADLVEVLEQPPARLSGHRPPVPALPAPPAPPPAARDPLRAGADRRRRRRARRGRRLAAQVLVGLLVVLLVLAGVWLALGLVEARRDLVVGAAALPWPTATLDLRVDNAGSLFATVVGNDRSPIPAKVIVCSTTPSNPPPPWRSWPPPGWPTGWCAGPSGAWSPR